jgi:hypothetical protein
MGALAGVIAVTAHNFAVSGQALQSSARMKSLWSAAEGRSPRPFILTFLSLFGRPTPLTFRICAAIAVLALIAGSAAMARGGADRRGHIEWAGAALTVFGYVAFNGFNPTSAQSWYTANTIVPAFLFIAVPTIEHRMLRAVPWLMTALLLALLVRETPRALTFMSDRPHPDQVSMYRAGRYLEASALPGRVGSWNAGIIGFYEGGRVVNLDGLVNNDVYQYSARNRLLQYMDGVSVKYVVDFEQMVTSDYYRKRGGYDDPSVLERFVPLRRFDDRTEGWSRMTLYRVLPAGGE